MDDVAPVKEKTISVKPRARWFSDQIFHSRVDFRSSEIHWRRSGLEVDWQIFGAKRAQYHCLLDETKNTYFRSRIENADQRNLFKEIDKIPGINGSCSTLPTRTDPLELAQHFSDFFDSKIEGLRSQFTDSPATISFVNLGCHFSEFSSVPEENVLKLIKSMKSKNEIHLWPVNFHHPRNQLSLDHFSKSLASIQTF